MALYGPLCYEAPVAAHGYVTVVTVLLKAVFPGVEPDVRRRWRAMAVVARPVRSAQGWSRRGSLTRAECSAFVLSTVHSARPWRVRPSDAPAGDAIPPPTLPRSLPGETSTELDAFPYSLTKLRRPPFCAHFPCSCGRLSWRLRRCFICQPAGANCETRHRFSRPADMRLDQGFVGGVPPGAVCVGVVELAGA